MEHGDGIEVVQEHDTWTVRLWWPAGAVTGGPQRIVIEPADGAPAGQVAQGIATTTLRRVDLAGAKLKAAEYAPAATDEAGPLDRFGPAARRLLDDEGVSPSYLACLSKLYAAVADSGERAPGPQIAKCLGRPLETVRTHLKAARRDGYLTTVRGKAGGELTAKAHGILEALTPSG